MKKSSHMLSRLGSFARPYLKSYAFVFIAMLIYTGISLLRPKLVQVLIDDHLSFFLGAGSSIGLEREHLAAALQIGLIYLGAVIVEFISMYLCNFHTQRTGAVIVTDMRQQLYSHVLRLPMTYFDRHSIGGIVTRVTNDTENVLELYTYVFVNIFNNLATMIGVLIVMLSLDVKLSLFVLLLSPVIGLISFVFQKKIRKVYDKQRAIRSVINTRLSEDISGMNIVQTFHREKQIYQEFDATNQDYYRESRREVIHYAIYRPSVEMIRALGLALLLWLGGLSQLNGVLTFGVVYAFINYIERFFQPILGMAEILNFMQSAFSSADRIFALFDQKEEPLHQGISAPEGGFTGKIEFDHVWFRYQSPQEDEDDGTADREVVGQKDSEQWILKDVSFTVEPGSFVAFVGATGAGKSTILSLIARFYTVDRGEIRIDGVNVNDYDLVSLRRALGIVQQDVFLFKGDILSNIAIGRSNVDRRRAIEASRLVNADDFISRLPKGYDAPVEERGTTLSAGQRQLLSFARTIAGDPSILILDEATANIDTQTEQLIQEAITKMSENRTMLAVAHRISTISGADQIIVMHHGEIAEQGTQDELIEKDGLFRVLYELQYGEEAQVDGSREDSGAGSSSVLPSV